MARLNLSQINAILDANECSEIGSGEILHGWEECFGVDCPGYIPYWVEYMPFDKRYAYLNSKWQSFNDFVPAMLSKEFNWKDFKTIYCVSQLDSQYT